MQLFELVSPRLFRPLAGPNRAFYAELLLLLWEECRHTADYSISRAEPSGVPRITLPHWQSPLRWMPTVRAIEDEQPPATSHAGQWASAAAAPHGWWKSSPAATRGKRPLPLCRR